MGNASFVADSVKCFSQPVIILNHGEEEINVEASYKSLWKQVLRSTNEGGKVQRKTLDKNGGG